MDEQHFNWRHFQRSLSHDLLLFSADQHHDGFIGLTVGVSDVSPDSDDRITLLAGTGISITSGTSTVTITNIGSGGGGTGSAHVIYENSTPLTQRANLAFVDGLLASDDGAGTTNVSVDYSTATMTVETANAVGTVKQVARANHVHAHGSGYLPDAHHAQSHVHDNTDGSGTVAHSNTTGRTADDHHAGFVGLKSGATTVLPDAGDLITLAAGSNITLTPSGNTITIASTASAGVTAHNALTGLTTGDDHPQYTQNASVEVISALWRYDAGIQMQATSAPSTPPTNMVTIVPVIVGTDIELRMYGAAGTYVVLGTVANTVFSFTNTLTLNWIE